MYLNYMMVYDFLKTSYGYDFNCEQLLSKFHTAKIFRCIWRVVGKVELNGNKCSGPFDSWKSVYCLFLLTINVSHKAGVIHHSHYVTSLCGGTFWLSNINISTYFKGPVYPWLYYKQTVPKSILNTKNVLKQDQGDQCQSPGFNFWFKFWFVGHF